MKAKPYHIFLIVFFFFFISVGLKAQEGCDHEPDKKAEKFFKSAMDARGKSMDLVMQNLDKAIEEDPEYLEALWLRAEYLRKRYMSEREAFNDYMSIIKLCPSFMNYYANFFVGQIYYDRKEYGLAEKYAKIFLDNVNTDIVPDSESKLSQRRAENEAKKISNDYNEATELVDWAGFYHRLYDNPVPFKPKLIPGLNTELEEYSPYISADGEYAIFTRKYPENRVGVGGSMRKEFVEKLTMSVKSGDGYTKGDALDYPFNQLSKEGAASLTIDNKTMFFSRGIMMPTYLNFDIYYVKYSNGFWGDVMLVDSINTENSFESTPSISSDGKTLYFTSDRPSGYGGIDLYKSVLDTSGVWSAPINLGPEINTPGDEIHPFIHPDNKTLYFSSRDVVRDDKAYLGHRGLGNYDVFVTKLDENGEWKTPVNVGYPINTENDELGFLVSTSGKKGYLASRRMGDDNQDRPEQYDIYEFDLYADIQPDQVLFIKGDLKDEETKQAITEAKVEIKNVKTKKVTQIPVNIETGEYVAVLPFQNDYILTVKKEDYAFETKYIARKDPKNQIPIKMDFEVKPLKVGQAYPLSDIYFATGSDSLTEESLWVIDGFCDYLNEFRTIKVDIHGHTDNVGQAASNLELSNARAKSVYDYMVSKGISASRLNYKGFGEEKPIATNSTEEGRALNRRTEFVIVKK